MRSFWKPQVQASLPYANQTRDLSNLSSLFLVIRSFWQ